MHKRTTFGLAAIVAVTVSSAGCGEGPDDPVDISLRDLGATDVGMLDGGVSDLDGGGGVDLGTIDQGGGVDQGGTIDQGVATDMGGVYTGPTIANVAWEFPGDCPTGASNSIFNTRLYIVFSDPDHNAVQMDLAITNIGTCSIGSPTTASEMITVALMNCPVSQSLTPTITLTDPDDNSDSVSGFTITSCVAGSYFP